VKENGEGAGPSSSTGEIPTPTSNDENKGEEDEDEDEEEEGNEGDANEEDGGNLEVAWYFILNYNIEEVTILIFLISNLLNDVCREVLQNAALIFQRQGDDGLLNLLEVYNEMAGISLENGNFSLAIDDFSRALTTFSCLDDDKRNNRIAAEINYKIGLCQSMEKYYDESVKSFQTAYDLLDNVIKEEKARSEQTDEITANIKDLEETQQEIKNKMTEIGEIKAEEVEQVKRELTKLYGGITNGTSSTIDADGAGCSSSSSAVGSSSSNGSVNASTMKPSSTEKPKPTDISHLIKRKKPDTSDAVESSPAKKKLVETSPGETKVVAVSEEKPIENNTESVQVAVDN
jgi:nuclear autoantigenic sperm protein